MTVKEFWEKVDSINVDEREDGRYTEDEIYELGCAFIALTGSEKREIGGWDKLVELLQPLGKDGELMTKGETLRCWVKSRRYAKDEIIHDDRLISGKTIDDITFEEFENQTEVIKRNLYKQQVKTRDTMNSYRRILRDEARLEDFKDLMKECVKDLPELTIPYADFAESDVNTQNEAVLLLSDLHIGMEVNNFYNHYNIAIAKKRVAKLVTDTITYCRRNNVSKLNIVNLGDLVHGTIHTSARLEQEVDVVQQIMTASEILASALNELQSAAPQVCYRSCTDNHARALPNLHESIEAENYGKLIDFYLKARLAASTIEFCEDNIDQEIGLFTLRNGDKLAFAHGHHDSYNQAFQNYCGMTKEYIKYVCLGHFHASKTKSFMGAKVIINGCICGVDQYAFSKRLFGTPEQTLMIFENKNLININIDLDIQE